MKITDPEVIKNGERELIDTITGDIDWDAIEKIFRERHNLEIQDDVEYRSGDIVVFDNKIAYKLDFDVKVTLSVLFDRNGQHIALTTSGDLTQIPERSAEPKDSEELLIDDELTDDSGSGKNEIENLDLNNDDIAFQPTESAFSPVDDEEDDRDLPEEAIPFPIGFDPELEDVDKIESETPLTAATTNETNEDISDGLQADDDLSSLTNLEDAEDVQIALDDSDSKNLTFDDDLKDEPSKSPEPDDLNLLLDVEDETPPEPEPDDLNLLIDIDEPVEPDDVDFLDIDNLPPKAESHISAEDTMMNEAEDDNTGLDIETVDIEDDMGTGLGSDDDESNTFNHLLDEGEDPLDGVFDSDEQISDEVDESESDLIEPVGTEKKEMDEVLNLDSFTDDMIDDFDADSEDSPVEPPADLTSILDSAEEESIMELESSDEGEGSDDFSDILELESDEEELSEDTLDIFEPESDDDDMQFMDVKELDDVNDITPLKDMTKSPRTKKSVSQMAELADMIHEINED